MPNSPEKVTIAHLHAMKAARTPISMLTAYDYPTAHLIDAAGLDMILVGDSLGMVVHGFENTLPVTVDMMVLHTAAVRRGVQRAFVVADMPFMSYQASPADALRNAARLLAEGGADAVKLEGGRPIAGTVRALVQAGVAVMGHIGLTPQSISALDGFKVQGKTVAAAESLLADAIALQTAGAFALVLEAIPARLAELITARVEIPTVGIGAGAACDGQVLVNHDMLGLYERLAPKFVRQFADLGAAMREAFAAYHAAVRAREFPAAAHSFKLPDDVWAALQDYDIPPNADD